MRLHTHTPHHMNHCIVHELCSDVFTKNAVVVRYAVGSIHDPQGKEGLTHLVEHLVFGGNNLDVGKISLEKKGVSMSATTHKEYTSYSAASYFLSAPDLLSALCGVLQLHPTQADLLKEKEIIKSEILLRQKEGYDVIYDEVMKLYTDQNAIYKSYQHPITGTLESLERISLEDVIKHIDTYYINPCIVVATNQSIHTEDFSNISSLFRYKTSVSVQSNFNHNHYGMSQTAVRVHNDYAVATFVTGMSFINRSLYVSLLRDYMANNWSSLGNMELRVRQGVTYFVNGFAQTQGPFTVSYVYCEASEENYAKIKKTFDTLYERMFNGHIDADVFEATKNMLVTYLYDTLKNEIEAAEMFAWLNHDCNTQIITLDDYIATLHRITMKDFELFVQNKM